MSETVTLEVPDDVVKAIKSRCGVNGDNLRRRANHALSRRGTSDAFAVTAWLVNAAILDLPDAIAVGDTVNLGGLTTNPGTVLAIDGVMAWVLWPATGHRNTHALARLRKTS